MKTIIQRVKFKASPAALFEMYLDSKKHSQISKHKAVLSRKTGGSYSAYGGYIHGKNQLIVPNRMIVQTWRAKDWKKSDKDSVLILDFQGKGNAGEVLMIHANVPDNQAKGLSHGWNEFYWKPWKKFIGKSKG